MAGFADGVSGGISTDVIMLATGEPVPYQGGYMWNMGQISGIGTLLLIGFSNPVTYITYTANIGTASWGAVWQVATDGYQDSV